MYITFQALVNYSFCLSVPFLTTCIHISVCVVAAYINNMISRAILIDSSQLSYTIIVYVCGVLPRFRTEQETKLTMLSIFHNNYRNLLGF